MHNPKQRRRDLIKRVLTYLTMTTAVITLAAVSLFVVLGYSVDRDGQPEQGGLLQLRSFPTGASVTLDGALQSFKTNGKKNTSAGHHSIGMTLDEYRDWSKSFDLGRGELLWLNALLIPEKIITEDILPFESIASMKASPDRKWIAIIEKPNQPNIKLIDIRNEKKPEVTELIIPEAVAKSVGPQDIFKISEWDFGSRYLLVKHISGGKTDWIRFDRSDPANSRNISNLKNIIIDDGHFVGTSGNLLYVLSKGEIKKIDISSEDPVGSPIAEGVREFQLYKDDRIAYVSTDPTRQIVGFYNEAQTKPVVVRYFEPGQLNVHSAISNYFNDDYQAISSGTSVEIIKSPLTKNKQVIAKFELASGIKWLYFSNNGRFVVAQNGFDLSVYDIERKQSFVFNIPENPAYKSDQPLKWLDDFRFISDAGGKLVIFEFDGSNIENIGSAVEGYDAVLSNNGKRLFNIDKSPSTGKLVLRSSVMVVE